LFGSLLESGSSWIGLVPTRVNGLR